MLQAVHGWSSTYERLVKSQKFFSSYLTQEDLSRFGRNYVGVGEYLEHVFPLLNVRFISVSDSVDSYLDPRSVNNLVVPFKNILNDEYARDISNKVRASLDLKRRQGKFIGSFASYG